MGHISHAFAKDYTHSKGCDGTFDWDRFWGFILWSIVSLTVVALIALSLIALGRHAFHTPTQAELQLQERKDRALTDEKKRFEANCASLHMWADDGNSRSMWECKK